MSSNQDPQFLLLQSRRPTDPTAAHEHECFAESLDVPMERIRVHNLLMGMPAPQDLDDHLLLLGGSGEFSVLDSEPFVRGFLDLLEHEIVANSRPTFCSCFGFQGLVLAGGGSVIHDTPNTEVGTFELTLTEAGLADPLLTPLAPSFKAQEGHKDRADRLPTGMDYLAYSSTVPYEGFRLEGTPIFATQFHPELSMEANTKRYLWYSERYGKVDVDNDAVLGSMEETVGATLLLRRWVEEVCSSGQS